MTNDTRTADRHPAQYVALVLGVIYTIVGIWGFLQTGFDGFAHHEGELLVGLFEVNPLHNLAHLGLGVAGLAMWNRLGSTRAYGWLLAIAYGALFVFGLFVADTDEPVNVLALNAPDNWLHVGTAVVGLVIALWPARESRREVHGDRVTTGNAGVPGTSARGTATPGGGATATPGSTGGSETRVARQQPRMDVDDDLRVEHDDRPRERR